MWGREKGREREDGKDYVSLHIGAGGHLNFREMKKKQIRDLPEMGN